jgi:hypothetical protein
MENVVSLEVTEPTSNPNEEIYLTEQQARKIVLLLSYNDQPLRMLQNIRF